MVSITFISRSIEQSKEIVNLLLTKNLIIEGTIIDNAHYYRLKSNGATTRSNSVMLVCTSKSSLISPILNLLNNKYLNNTPISYSVPIVNSDWKKAKNLLSDDETDDLCKHFY